MLSWDHSPHATTGTSAHVGGISGALVAAGHDVVIVTVRDGSAADVGRSATTGRDARFDARVDARIEVADGDLPWIAPDHDLARTISANHAMVDRAVRLERDGGRWVPDVVHGHDWQVAWAANSLASTFAVPLVMSFHGVELMRHSGQLPAGVPSDIHAIEWWIALRASAVIAATHLMVEQLVSGFELDPERVTRIPNGVDPAEWTARSPGAPPLAAPSERPPHVVSWGNIQYEKGFQVLARAIHVLRATVPEVRCTIAGRGRYLAELQTQIDVEGVSDLIDLPGYLPFPALRDLVQSARCVVIPSLYEPFGIVALEAMASGTPLVVARTGGLAELVAGTGAGLTFEPGSPYALADTVERILTDGVLADQLVGHAKALVHEHYTWRAIADRTIECYRSARPS
jgi:glycogen(starch) synthase